MFSAKLKCEQMVAKCNENRITGKQQRRGKERIMIKRFRIETAAHHPNANAVLLCQHRRLRHYEVVAAAVALWWFTLKFIVYALVNGHADSIWALRKKHISIAIRIFYFKNGKAKTTKITAWKVGIKWSRARYFQVLKQLARKPTTRMC